MNSSSASRQVRAVSGVVAILAAGVSSSARVSAAEGKTAFAFGSGPVAPGDTRVMPADIYSKERGYGFDHPGGPPFVFHVDLPEGNYRVTVKLGDPSAPGSTTIKAESRRLMLEKVETRAGAFETRMFTVNIRTPKIAGDGAVQIDRRESGPPIVRPWDDKLTLEFNGKHPAVAAVEIAEVSDAITVFLAGDSTVTEQPSEPWAGWGQMLPRFFKPDIAVANYAQSGLALRTFEAQKRLAKILSVIKPGDYLFVQFGHNDQKDKSPGAGPFTTYKDQLKQYIAAVRNKRGIPVLVTPMERRRWSRDGKPEPTLTDFAEAVRQTGKEETVPVIDLNAMSLKLYGALGPENSKKAFVHYPAGTFPGQEKELKDDTHHNAYGAYELAKCVVEGIRNANIDLKKHLLEGLPAFDPARPDPVDSFDLSPSPFTTTEKPAGS